MSRFLLLAPLSFAAPRAVPDVLTPFATRTSRFLSYEIIQRGLNKYRPDLSAGTVNFLSGGMASNFFWVAAFPFDAVKKSVLLLSTHATTQN